MIRYICKSYLPYRWMIKHKVFHPSLDRLAELALQSIDADPDVLISASAEFSRIHQNLLLQGVWKWTGRHRLKQMDRLLSEHLADQGYQHLHMLDIGASDGITSLDTVDYLGKKNKISLRVTMLDQVIELFSINTHGATLYFTSSRRPILLRLGKLAVCLEPMQGIEGVLFNYLAAILARQCTRKLQHVELNAARLISLINPAVLQSRFIEVCECDLFNPRTDWTGKYDVVRASNILNIAYFSEARILEAVGLAHRYLKEGGILMVSRNLIHSQGETEMGALWQKQGNRFFCISKLSRLPEVAGLVDRFRLPRDSSVAPCGPVHNPLIQTSLY